MSWIWPCLAGNMNYASGCPSGETIFQIAFKQFILWQDLVKYRHCEIGSYLITVTFDWGLGSSVAKTPGKFQNDRIILTQISWLRVNAKFTIRRLTRYWNGPQSMAEVQWVHHAADRKTFCWCWQVCVMVSIEWTVVVNNAFVSNHIKTKRRNKLIKWWYDNFLCLRRKFIL